MQLNKQAARQMQAHLDTLWAWQDSLFERGHTFWFCDAQDGEYSRPFYYYQRNRIQDMATCSTCGQLIKNRRQIRTLERALSLPLTPLITHYREENHIKRMSVHEAGDFNPNFRYLGD